MKQLRKELTNYLNARVASIMNNETCIFNDALNDVARKEERRITMTAARERYSEISNALPETY